MRLTPGEILCGKYRVVRVLAEGGMGTVYEARHEMLGTGVALKMLHPELASRQGLVARFVQEARVSAQIRSTNVVQVTDVEQDPRGPFLVMELLAGESLQQRLERDRRLDRGLALDVALQVLAGLAVAHAMGVVHRDLKPDNVFLVPTPQGTVAKVLDFGIAKLRTIPEARAGLTRPGVIMGTAEYMAPEQAYSADTVDARADLYSVGVMLFEMLAGHRPVDGQDAHTIAQAVLQGRVHQLGSLDPSLPPGLVAAVHRAMDPRAPARFSSAEEMQRAVLPFATVLSAAGHQAAALATGTFAMTPPPASARASVPRTLPPEGGGTTAPREPLAIAMTPPAPVAMTNAGYDARTHLSPGPPQAALDEHARNSYSSTPSYAPPAPYTQQAPQYAAQPQPQHYGPPPAAPSRGTPAWVIALLAAAAGGLAVALVVLLRKPDESPPPTTPTATATAVSTPTPTVGATTAPPTPTLPPPGLPPTATPPHPTPSSSTKKPDAGAPDAGAPPGFPPIPNFFDAGLPPMPSALPTAITIPIPGFPPFPGQ